MKVVFLDTTLDGSLIGGAQIFLHKILAGLSQRNIEVHFVTKGTSRSKAAPDIKKTGAVFHNNIWPKSALTEDAAPLFAKWLEELKPDVYVVSVSPDIGWAVLPYLPPQIATMTIGHNDSDTFYLPAKHYGSFLTKVVGVSDEICRKYVSASKLKQEQVTWIPYGVESYPVPLKKNLDSPLSLVYVGRLEDEQKRASDLILIIKELSRQQLKFDFKIIGDGPLVSIFEKELSGEIFNGTVQLTGWLGSKELMKNLRKADIFILTSAYEGFCISLVEAMANGCCPIVTDIQSGNKQLVSNGKNGFIVPVGDIKKFAEVISLLDSGRDKLFEFRQKAWEVGRGYSIEQMVDRYYKCFLDAINEARENPRQKNPLFPLMESCRSNYPLWIRRVKAKLFTLLN